MVPDRLALSLEWIDAAKQSVGPAGQRHYDLVSAANYAELLRTLCGEPNTPVCVHANLMRHNILVRRPDRAVRFVGLKCAGMGDPMVDLGKLCSQLQLGPEALAVLLRAYYGNAPDRAVIRRVQAYAARETMLELAFIAGPGTEDTGQREFNTVLAQLRREVDQLTD